MDWWARHRSEPAHRVTETDRLRLQNPQPTCTSTYISTSGPSRSSRLSRAARELPFVRSRARADRAVPAPASGPYVIDLLGRGAGSPRRARRARRPRPGAAVPVEPARDRVAAARAGDAADRRLPRGRAGARRSVRRVGRARARPAGPATTSTALLDRGCVGLSLPAGALSGVERSSRLRRCSSGWSSAARRCSSTPVPARGPRTHAAAAEPSLEDPLWWPALTRYVAEMHAAWLAFLTAGRAEHPRAARGLLDARRPRAAASERLASRGGPVPHRARSARCSTTPPPTAPSAVSALAERRRRSSSCCTARTGPVVEPGPSSAAMPRGLDWEPIARRHSARAFAAQPATTRRRR